MRSAALADAGNLAWPGGRRAAQPVPILFPTMTMTDFHLQPLPGLELRPRSAVAAAELFALTVANRDHLRPWLPWVEACREIADTEAHLAECATRAALDTGLGAGIWWEGRLVGVIDFHDVQRVQQRASIGYWLDAAHGGRGLMTATLRAWVEFGFTTYDLHRQELAAAVDNRRSRAVAERAGFALEGIAAGRERRGEGFVDHAIYALTRPSWVESRRPAAATGLTVRPMRAADLPAALALWHATEGMGMSPNETVPMLTAFLARNPDLSQVAVDDRGELAGAVLVGQDGRRGMLYHLAVVPAHRRAGLGRRLVDAAQARLHAQGIGRTLILVYADNAPALAFWRREGWDAWTDIVTLAQVPRPRT
jgi:ribosomal-protein-serine acetyltransferase